MLFRILVALAIVGTCFIGYSAYSAGRSAQDQYGNRAPINEENGREVLEVCGGYGHPVGRLSDPAMFEAVGTRVEFGEDLCPLLRENDFVTIQDELKAGEEQWVDERIKALGGAVLEAWVTRVTMREMFVFLRCGAEFLRVHDGERGGGSSPIP